jgi:hypothetical protein
MSNKSSPFQKIRERKRIRNEVNEPLSMLENLSLEDMESTFTAPHFSQSHMLALLVLRFGVMSLFLARYVIKEIPALLPTEMKGKILRAFFPSHKTEEVNFLINHLHRVSDFMNNSMVEEKIQHACEITDIPFKTILCPPVECCIKCGGKLSLHNKPAHVTVYRMSGPVRSIKISLKCSLCGIVYKYAQHGTNGDGYLFYPERRLLVEGSNVAYLERQLCLYQVSLRYYI